jgi:hypothetical protein
LRAGPFDGVVAPAEHHGMKNKTPYRPLVFISYYSRGTDAKVATALRKALVVHRVRVDTWRDREDLEPGSTFAIEIQKAIVACDFFIIVLSRRSVGSLWCRRERGRAEDLKKTIIILYADDVDAADWPLELQGIQYVDVRSGLKSGMSSLLATLGVAEAGAIVLDDPLDRDAARITEFAQFFFTFDSNRLLPAANAKLVVRRQGPVMLETPRAKDIIERVCTSNETNFRALGRTRLSNRWSHRVIGRDRGVP